MRLFKRSSRSQSPHPFRRLRSFHLLASKPCTHSASESNPEPCFTATRKNSLIARTLPLRGAVIIRLALIASLVFISTICLCFIGADVEEDYFKKALTQIAQTEPGVVLLGENVDVDVDEPSITIRWSILACGKELFLEGSAGAHGSTMCGLPAQALRIFVDKHSEPAAKYDPIQIPFDRDTGSRRSVQNLVQFDSDHVLDVHKAHLYPFDSYVLTSTIRALSESNETVPIRRLLTIQTTSSFDVDTIDTETYSTSASDTTAVTYASRDIDMHVARPASARLITIMLFTLNWIMAHVAGGLAYMCGKLTTIRSILFLSAGAILTAIPQLRNSMPDAPGFDGILIDTIGYFPQMIIAAGSTIVIFLTLVVQLIDQSRNSSSLSPVLPPTVHRARPRPPSIPTRESTAAQVAQYERDRVVRHMNGEFVFPPVAHAPSSSGLFDDTTHRRSRPIMSPAKTESYSAHSSDRTVTQASIRDWMSKQG